MPVDEISNGLRLCACIVIILPLYRFTTFIQTQIVGSPLTITADCMVALNACLATILILYKFVLVTDQMYK